MKKQLLLSTLAVVAVAGYLHADENRPEDSTRDKKEVSEAKRSLAKVVVAEEVKGVEEAEENDSDSSVTRKKGKKDKKKDRKTSKKEKKENK